MFNRTAAAHFQENSSSSVAAAAAAAAEEGIAQAGQEYSWLVFEFIIPGVLLNTIGEEILYRTPLIFLPQFQNKSFNSVGSSLLGVISPLI